MKGPLIVLGAALLWTVPEAWPRSGEPAPPIVVAEATWGGRCGAPAGNATDYVRKACAELSVCLVEIDPERLGDPAPGCDKRLAVTLACTSGGKAAVRTVEGAATERVVLSCGDVIDVLAATYGDNCGAQAGNVTADLADACEGEGECRYVIDFEVLGDPAPGCAKRYHARWRCTGGGEEQRVEVPPEAGAKHGIALRCPVKGDGGRLSLR